MARAVEKLSDLYVEKNAALNDIWRLPELAQAYVSYYLPLNLLRLLGVLQEARDRGFFDGLTSLLDFGSGPGTLDLALGEASVKFAEYTFIEKSREAQNWHKKLRDLLGVKPVGRAEWLPDQTGELIKPETKLVVFSYSLNEMTELPAWAQKAEALMILEPSTQFEGRRLQALRQELLKQGYFAWAPCTHQKKCPLQEHSKTDWCHQRVHIELSKNLKQIEQHLKMKNQTLTYSYLLMRKTAPAANAEMRVIGDTLYERGKVRQAVCRGENREFLTWLTRHGEPTPIPRGQRLPLPLNIELKGNELRMPHDT